MEKTRLDQRVYDLGLAESRERAKALIMAGQVYVDGQRQLKPGAAVTETADVQLRGEKLPYVSRGGLKLEKALNEFQIDPAGFICVDCGASTGGFTDCLLQRGAKHVFAVDVGYGQLAWALRQDERVTVMERTNARNLTPDMFPGPANMAVMDMSFISLRLVLPAVRELLTPAGQVVCLVKPQFEAGRELVGKKGVVRDPAVHRQVLETFIAEAAAIGFVLRGLTFSPVRGPEGNIEYLAWLGKEGSAIEADCEDIVRQSHEALDR
ncbi:MAG: TlyA family RNA methyltransferase [Oscillospiraceae bacterium]|nr:TlyA family RNA methyltransferase [Oscillospiraceae bacterium]